MEAEVAKRFRRAGATADAEFNDNLSYKRRIRCRNTECGHDPSENAWLCVVLPDFLPDCFQLVSGIAGRWIPSLSPGLYP
jgi:hypothetical protein